MGCKVGRPVELFNVRKYGGFFDGGTEYLVFLLNDFCAPVFRLVQVTSKTKGKKYFRYIYRTRK